MIYLEVCNKGFCFNLTTTVNKTIINKVVLLHDLHSKPSSLQKPLALIQIILPALVIPGDLEDLVSIHTQAVVMAPGLQHCLAPSLVLGECFVATYLSSPEEQQIEVETTSSIRHKIILARAVLTIENNFIGNLISF